MKKIRLPQKQVPGDPCVIVKDDLFGIAKKLKAFDEDLVVLFNYRTGCYEVHDLAAPGGPRHTMVLRVMDETGENPGILDNRVLETIMKNKRSRWDEIFAQLERDEETRETNWQTRTDDIGEAAGEDLKWMGQAVVPSVAWEARRDKDSPVQYKTTSMREAIRDAGNVGGSSHESTNQGSGPGRTE